MDKKKYELNYWKQYTLLEQEFIKTMIYVEIDQANFKTYSSMYLKLLLEIGSEVENVLKEMCNTTGRTTITDYAQQVLQRHPNIINQVVQVKDKSISIIPFAGWNTTQPSKSLGFWNAYNDVKHDRISNYQKATLENVICALAGLFLLEMYRINEIYAVDTDAFQNFPDDEESKLFILSQWEGHLRTSKIKSPYPCFDDDNNERLV